MTNNEYLDNDSVDNISDMDMDTGTHRTYKISEYDLGNLVLNSGQILKEQITILIQDNTGTVLCVNG